MIPLAEINTVADRFKVPAETVEKDYVISWILFCLSHSTLKDKFIFYGGTAIKRIYFEDHRFSEDIDLLSNNRFTLKNIIEALEVFQLAKEMTNLVFTIDKQKALVTKNRIQLFIQYSGYDEIVGAPKEVRLDLAMSMDLFGETTKKQVIKSYSDHHQIRHETLSVMTLNTILANKLGLLLDITRNEPRDLFDIWFLMKRIDKFDFDIEKLGIAFYSKYGFHPSCSIFIQHLKNNSYQKNWHARLSKQIAALPDIKIIIKEIEFNIIQVFK